ncbi:MAG: hypothetical protein ACI87O_001461 [Planctomycetota bacterium]|jgi:hypothetical protein
MMDLSASTLFASLFVSTIGMGLFMYGKKQIRVPQIIAGVTLMAFPYLVGGAYPVLGLGVVILLALHLAVRAGY